jgi:sulfonate transport system substrate-binding protein
MVRKFLICVSVVLVLVSVLAPPSMSAAKVEKIAVTYVKLPLNVPTIITKRLGLLEKEFAPDKITIQLPELTAGPQQTEAIAAGSVQVASVLSIDSAILAKANGIDLKVVAVFCRAPKGFNIMAKNPSITKVADLKGKTVAGPKGSMLNQLLFAALKKEGLKPGDVKYVNMGGVQAQAGLVSGSIDAALIAGPSLVAAEASGARVIANGQGLVSGLLVVAVSGPFLKEQPDLVKRYLKVHEQSLQYLKDRQGEAIKLVAEETQISEADVKRMLPWYDFNPRIKESDLADMEGTRDFLREVGMLSNPLNINDLVAVIR